MIVVMPGKKDVLSTYSTLWGIGKQETASSNLELRNKKKLTLLNDKKPPL